MTTRGIKGKDKWRNIANRHVQGEAPIKVIIIQLPQVIGATTSAVTHICS